MTFTAKSKGCDDWILTSYELWPQHRRGRGVSLLSSVEFWQGSSSRDFADVENHQLSGGAGKASNMVTHSDC